MMNETSSDVIGERCRQFGLSDVMILTAGSALALTASRYLIPLMFHEVGQLLAVASAHRTDVFQRWPVFWGATHDHLRNGLWYGFQLAEAFLVGFTLAFFWVRLRRPRPSWRILIRQPGTVAALAMIFGLFWGTGALIAWFPGWFDSLSSAPTAVGGSVAVAWILLALARKWMSERGWIDRMGRLLGCVAIALPLVLGLVFRI